VAPERSLVVIFDTMPMGLNSPVPSLMKMWSPFLRLGPSVLDVSGVVAVDAKVSVGLPDVTVAVHQVATMQCASYSSSKMDELLTALMFDLSKLRMALLLLLRVMRFPAVRYEGTDPALGL
jgi:hypothetical protein